MIQSNFNFPLFVADQVLSANTLNDLTTYLEEQDRLTRAMLLGIGIVCGGDITIAQNVTSIPGGTTLSMTKMCAITSMGYLIVKGDQTYISAKPFYFEQDNKYDTFCNDYVLTTPPTPHQHLNKFDMWELFPSSVTDAAPLSTVLHKDMVVVMLYDQKTIAGQNCNPESCDGLGAIIENTVRAFLVNKADIDALHQTSYVSYANSVNANIFSALPDISINRFNTPFSRVTSTGEFFAAYKKIFSTSLITGMESSFTALYNAIRPMIDAEFETNPFAGFAAHFQFLNDGSLSQPTNKNHLIHLEYYFELFADLIATYNDLKELGFELSGACCPPGDLFKRHIYNGLIVEDTTGGTHLEVITAEQYYHAFLPTLILGNYRKAAGEVAMLFRRLVLQYQKFTIPQVTLTTNQTDPKLDSAIRITPTVYGPVPLSQKSIPFHYDVAGGNSKLYQNWNYKYKLTNRNHRNLSYHASTYNSSDNDVINPLAYNLEPYNFFNIDGINGKPIGDVLYNLETLKRNYRVPFTTTVVMTGSSDDENLDDILSEVRKFKNVPKALFDDLELDFTNSVSEVIDRFLQAARIIYDSDSCLTSLLQETNTIPSVIPLLKDAGDNFKVKPKTSGRYFEKYIYPNFKNKPYSSPFKGNPFDSLGNTTTLNDLGVQNWVVFYAPNLVYIMDAIYNLLNNELSDFAEKLDAFSQCWDDLIELCEAIRQFSALSYKQSTSTSALDMAIENLEDAIFSVETLGKGYVLRNIGESYLRRINEYAKSQTFANFSEAYPGLLHRDGVIRGGTLVLVMHNKAKPTTNAPQPPVVGNIRVKNKYAIWNKKMQFSLDAKKAKQLACKDCKTFDFKASLQAGNSLGVIGLQQFDALFLERMRFTFANLVDESVALENAFASVPDGTVIAKFFIPNYVTSELAPAVFTINMGDSPLFIDISPRSFVLNGDKTDTGTLRYGPPGGVLAFPDGAEYDNHLGDFSPSDFNNDYGPSNTGNFNPWYLRNFNGLKRVVTITYTKDGKMVSTTVTIYKKPTATFTVTNRSKSGNTLTVTVSYSASENYDNLAWTWGDGTYEVITPGSGSVTHVYNTAGKTQFAAILTTFNGTFPSTPFILNIPA